MAYGTDDGFNAWLAAQGLSLPADAPPILTLRAIGSAYVDSAYEYRLQCSRRTGGFNQDLAWPRTGHRVNGQSVPNDLIPNAWINASYRAAYLQASQPGWANTGTDPNRQTKREKVAVIEVEYFGGDAATKSGNAAAGFNVDPIIDGMLSVWLCAQGVRNINNLFRVV